MRKRVSINEICGKAKDAWKIEYLFRRRNGYHDRCELVAARYCKYRLRVKPEEG